MLRDACVMISLSYFQCSSSLPFFPIVLLALLNSISLYDDTLWGYRVSHCFLHDTKQPRNSTRNDSAIERCGSSLNLNRLDVMVLNASDS